MDGRVWDAYHSRKIIMCRHGSKRTSHLPKKWEFFMQALHPICITDKLLLLLSPNQSPSLFSSAPPFPTSPRFCLLVSWIFLQNPHPPSLSRCTWEHDCLSRWGSEGKRNSKSNNNLNCLPHHHFLSILQEHKEQRE